MSGTVRSRLARLADWMEGRAVAAGGSSGELAAVTVVTAFAALGSRSIEVLKPIAVAVLVAIAWGISEQALAGRRARSPAMRRLAVVLPPIALVFVSMWLLWPIWTNEKPGFLDQDNTTHVERARAFWEAVSHGHWPRWTNVLEGGEPLTDAYGWLGNFLPPFFRALTFNKITFDRGYVWTICSLHALASLSVYALARRFARRQFAFLAGLLFILGGQVVPYLTGDRPIWHLHLFMGLWHSLLSAIIAIFATAKLIDVVRRGRLGDAVAVTMLTTASCLSHGFGTVASVVMLGCTLVGGFLAPRAQSRRTSFAAVAVLSGLLVAAFWVVPASRVLAEYGLRFPRLPHEEEQSLLEFVGPVSTATLLAGGVACLTALFHRDRLLRGVSVAALSTILLDEAGVVGELGLADSGAGHAMQWHRLTVIFVLASAAPFAVMLDRAVDRATSRSLASLAWRTIGVRAIGLSIFFVLMLPPLGYTIGHGRHLLQTIEPYKLEDPGAFQLLETELIWLRASDPDKFRVYFASRTNLGASMALALRTGVPITAMINPPGLFLKNRPQVGDLEEMRAWGCKYLLVDVATPVSPNWVKERSIGPYALYRDVGFLGLARAPKGVTATVTTLEDDQIRVRVAGAPPEGADVQLAVAYYPRFRAERNGVPIAVNAAASRAGGPPDQLLVHVADGEVVLAPTKPLPGALVGRFETLVGLALLLAMILSRTSPRFAERLARVRALPARLAPFATPRRTVALGAVAVVVVIVGVALPRGASTHPCVPAFFGARAAVQRNGESCPQSLVTRRWICGDAFAPAPAEVFHTVAAEPSPPPSLWPVGDAWSALRIVDREGKSTIQVRFPRANVQRWVHVRLAPFEGAPKSIALRVGKRAPLPVQFVHGWATVDTGYVGTSSLVLEVVFTTPGGLQVALASDGSAEAPSLPKQ